MKKLLVGASLVGVLAAAAVYAQTTPTPPQVAHVGTADLIQIIVNGAEVVGHQYATAAQVNGVLGYQDLGAATTGNTYTFNKGQVQMTMRPAGTLAAVTLDVESNPGDGQVNCFFSTQTTTALNWTAATGQTMGSDVPTAGVANTRQCIQYEAAAATWRRIM
jgi:hypothetical protein